MLPSCSRDAAWSGGQRVTLLLLMLLLKWGVILILCCKGSFAAVPLAEQRGKGTRDRSCLQHPTGAAVAAVAPLLRACA